MLVGITSVYLRGIDNAEIIHAVHERPGPMIPANATLSQRASNAGRATAIPAGARRWPPCRRQAPASATGDRTPATEYVA